MSETNDQRIYDRCLIRVGELEAENAKLRELVRDMYAVMLEDAAMCDVTYPEQFDDRMHELGIEVDE